MLRRPRGWFRAPADHRDDLAVVVTTLPVKERRRRNAAAMHRVYLAGRQVRT